MGESGATPRWDEVGDRFTRLGRTLQGRWAEQATRPAMRAMLPPRRCAAIDGVRVSLDELAHTITRTVNDAEVHDAARSAAGGLVEALSASLDDLAGKIQSRKD